MRPCLAVSRAFTLAALVSLPISVAHADWPAGGKRVSVPGYLYGVRNAVIHDLPNGELAVLGVGRGWGIVPDGYAMQRIGRDGVIRSGWPADGTAFGGAALNVPQGWHGLTVDDASFEWHSWSGGSGGMKALYLGPDREGLGTTYTVNTTAPSEAVRVATAPNGDAFVVSGNRLKRITRTGAIAAGWTATGVTLPNTFYEDTAILPDGAGGVIVFLRVGSGGIPVITRIDGNGVRHAGWPAGGKPVTDVPTPAVPVIVDHNSRMFPSGPDHFIVAWQYPTQTTDVYELFLQRFDLDGTIDPAWGTSALSVWNPGSFQPMNLIPDGSGGLYVVRAGASTPVATHITAAGTVLGAVDTPVNLPGDHYVPQYVYLSAPDAQIADRTPNGGLLVGWNDTRLAPTVSFRLRWLNPDLTPDASKPDTGLVYFPGSPHPYAGALLAIHADGDDAAFLAWGDYQDIGGGQSLGELWMTRVQAPAPVAGVPPRALASGLALSAPRPNPARGSVALDVTLADGAPARVELLDVTGRIVRRQTVQGVGAHAVMFNELGSFEPGLYFARISSGHSARSTRLVVTR